MNWRDITKRGRVGAFVMACTLALTLSAGCAQDKEDNSMLFLLLLLGGGGGGGGAGGGSSAGSGGSAGSSTSPTAGDTASVRLTSDLLITYANQSAFSIGGECTEENEDVTLSGAVIDTAECLSGVWTFTTDMAWLPSGRFYLYLDHSGAGGSAPQVEAVLEKNTLDEDATALYTFEDTGDPGKDHSLAGAHDAKKVKDVTVADDAERGKVLALDGTKGEFQLSDGKFFNNEFKERTLSLWARPNQLTGPLLLFDEGGSTNGMVLRIENDEAILAVRNGGAGSQQEARAALSNGADTWYHLSAQFDHGTLRLYVDGEVTETATGHAKISKHSDTGGMGRRYNSDAIGGSKKQPDYFDGSIDHFAVYETALSSNEVGMLAGLTPDPETIAPPGPLDIGMAAFYDFETSGEPGKDALGRHPAVTSNVKVVDDTERGSVGRFKKGGKFQISDGSFLNDEFEERSVAMWFKPNKLKGKQVLYDEGGATNGLTLKLEGKRLLAGVRAGGDGSQKTLSIQLDRGADVWYHTLVVFDRGEFKLYLDGTWQTLDAGYTKIPAHGNEGGAGLRHGNSDAFGESGTDEFNKGRIDDLRIYSRAVGDIEAELLTGTAPTELKIEPLEVGLVARYAFDDETDAGLDSFGGYSATAAGVTVVTDADRGLVGRFDGATANIPLSDGKFLNDAFTARSLSLWFRPNDTNALQVLYDEGGTTNGMALKIENGEVIASVRSGKQQHDAKHALAGAGVWYHAVVIFDNGDLTFYLDDAATVTATGLKDIPKHGDTGGLGSVHGGGDSQGNPTGSYFNGDLDDVRIYERVLTAEEVTKLGTVTDSSHPLGAYLGQPLDGRQWVLMGVLLVLVVVALGFIQLWRNRQERLG